MKWYILLVAIIFFIVSCKKESSIEELIAGEKYKYWLVKDDYNNRAKLILYFDRKGKCISYIIDPKGIFKKEEAGDIVYLETWELQAKDTIIIGGLERNIIKLNKDTLFCYNKHFNFELFLLAAPDSIIPKEYRRLQ